MEAVWSAFGRISDRNVDVSQFQASPVELHVTYARGMRFLRGLCGHFVQERTPDELSSYKVDWAHSCPSMKPLSADDETCRTEAEIV